MLNGLLIIFNIKKEQCMGKKKGVGEDSFLMFLMNIINYFLWLGSSDTVSFLRPFALREASTALPSETVFVFSFPVRGIISWLHDSLFFIKACKNRHIFYPYKFYCIFFLCFYLYVNPTASPFFWYPSLCRLLLCCMCKFPHSG
jgi:hypothetical protein